LLSNVRPSIIPQYIQHPTTIDPNPLLSRDQHLGQLPDHPRRQPLVVDGAKGIAELDGVRPEGPFGDVHLLGDEPAGLGVDGGRFGDEVGGVESGGGGVIVVGEYYGLNGEIKE
jgi:hypothetical protein